MNAKAVAADYQRGYIGDGSGGNDDSEPCQGRLRSHQQEQSPETGQRRQDPGDGGWGDMTPADADGTQQGRRRACEGAAGDDGQRRPADTGDEKHHKQDRQQGCGKQAGQSHIELVEARGGFAVYHVLTAPVDADLKPAGETESIEIAGQLE